MEDLRQLPRFDDSLSYLYLEHARIEQHDKAIAFHDEAGLTPVPAAAMALLMLGPGTSITHAAIKALADNNCTVAWVGEEGLRFYAAGVGGTRGSGALLRQARLVSDPQLRLAVVLRMYRKRFPAGLDSSLTLQQIRGMEGIRVREAYAAASRATGVPWTGRSYKRGDWAAADPVNRALSTGNACLYGLVQAAIISAGYSPALGFIHTGKQLSFVYDIADLYKADLVIPTAFDVARWQAPSVERLMRTAFRQKVAETRLMQRIIPDMADVLDVGDGFAPADDPAWDIESSAPGALWAPGESDGAEGRAEGGVNYGPDDA
ncbi:MAG: CRISPR-associated endonuclease Cas1 [Phycisphaerae bacterium]